MPSQLGGEHSLGGSAGITSSEPTKLEVVASSIVTDAGYLAELRKAYSHTLRLEPKLLSRPVTHGSMAEKFLYFARVTAEAAYEFVPSVPSPLQRAAQALVDHRSFDIAMIAVIIANTVVLAMPYEGMSTIYAQRLEYANWAFVACFAFDMLARLSAVGFRGYWTSISSAFDGAVTVISIADMILTIQGQQSTGISVIRIVRLSRAVRVIPGLQSIMSTIVAALPATL